MGLQVANELIFKACHLPSLSLFSSLYHLPSLPQCLTLFLFFFLALAALQDRAAAGLEGYQYCSVSAKCQLGLYTPSASLHQLEVCFYDG